MGIKGEIRRRPVLFLLMALFSVHTFAQLEPAESTDESLEVESVEMFDPVELEAFLDGIVAAQLEAFHLAGLAISIVKDGEVLLAKGYGYSDAEEKVPVNAETTLFRIGSVSKLFTWIAVMQLAEAGRLQLDVDVNRYLHEFKVPDTFPEPIQMRHLMTHTPGFEDRFIGLFARSEARMRPLNELIEQEMPDRVREPGNVAAYSNYGTALAGHIVSQVSGLPWGQYVEDEILAPLQMAGTTVRQPVPEHLQQHMAKGYVWEEGRLVEKGFEFVPLAPTGSISSSASDMARFMIANLQYGLYGGERILSEQAARQMQAPLQTSDQRIRGMAHGFILSEMNGENVVGHGGDTFYFHTGLLLVPEHSLGIFVSYNSEDGAKARDQLLKVFFDRYFPGIDDPKSEVISGFEERMQLIRGDYRLSRRPYTTLDKISEFISSARVYKEDEFLVTSGLGTDQSRWVEVSPFEFQKVNGTERLIFKADPASGAVSAYLANIPIFALEKASWYQTPRFHLLMLLANSLILLSTLVLPIIVFFAGDRDREVLARHEPNHPAPRWLAVIVAVFHLSFLVGFLVVLSDPTTIVFGVPTALRFLLFLPLIGGLLTIFLVLVSIMTWKGNYWGFFSRCHYSFVAVAALAFLWQLHYWNLLGWNY